MVFRGIGYWRAGGHKGEMTQLSLAGGIASTIVMFGLMTVPQFLFGDREDGTLLRLRGIPGAMTSYLTGKTLFVLVNLTASAVLWPKRPTDAAGRACTGCCPCRPAPGAPSSADVLPCHEGGFGSTRHAEAAAAARQP
ncbi:hypothetical protein GCM10010211_16200 [Streptomyces albospinus]|uniref:Uncharacterized protein n=1 Tax=Streptomyces albospinus TaxID=285515 RepID=A0ABQ2UUJ2_9ACTN|nr:hypothetical protein [Streptomyces albospinus]GGU52550.1 hypothetical protein GCM10010211_16200 [Streptomyces albospinus]